MEYPFYIKLPGGSILLHSVTEIASFFIAFRYYLFLKKKRGDHLPSQHRLWVILGATVGALIGSRLLGGLENPELLARAAHPLIYFYLNKTVVGGFLGGLAGVEITKKIIGEKENSGDLFTYPIILGLIIGRMGCFSMGVYEETYGLPTHWPTGMYLGDSFKRHPVCLYEMAFLLALWIFLKQIAGRRQPVNGALFKMFMISYLAFRFLLDFIKPHYTYAIGLSAIQIACMAGLLYYYRYFYNPRLLFTSYA